MSDIWQPYQDLHKRLLERQLEHIGLNIFDPNYRFNLISVFWVINIVAHLIISSISLNAFYGQLREFCYCFVTMPTGFVLSVRYYNFLFKKDLILEVFDTIKRLYMEFTDEEVEEKRLFKKYGEWIKKIAILTNLVFFFNAIMASLIPVIIYLFTGDVTLPFGFFIPGLNYKKNPGYTINYLHHMLEAWFVAAGYLPMFHLFTLFIGNSCFQLDAMIVKLKRFDEKLKEKFEETGGKKKNELKRFDEKLKEKFEKTGKKKDEVEIKPVKEDHMSELKHLVKLHQNFLTFVGSIDEIFSFQTFYDFFAVGCQVVIAFYVVTTEFWPTGYLIINAFIIPIFIQCLYGVFVEIKCEKLMNQIYEVKWHLLAVRERKVLVLFLESAQNTQLLTIAGYVPLNLETFSKAYNFCYSCLMFLLNRHKAHSGE